MDIKNLVSKLHPLERKLLLFITQHQKLQALVNASGLQEIEVMRALQWLENKNIVLLHTEKKKQISLGKNGLTYKKMGLPERIFLSVLDQEAPPEQEGTDVRDGVVNTDSNRLYNVIDGEYGTYTLTLEVDLGFTFNAFTFG